MNYFVVWAKFKYFEKMRMSCNVRVNGATRVNVGQQFLNGQRVGSRARRVRDGRRQQKEKGGHRFPFRLRLFE